MDSSHDLPPVTDHKMDLAEARAAYETALQQLADILPEPDHPPRVVDPTVVPWTQTLQQAFALVPRSALRGAINLGRLLRQELGEALAGLKARLLTLSQPEPAIIGGPAITRREQIRSRLLETLWARDHVQAALQRQNGASFEEKREALAFVMANEQRLQRLEQRALQAAQLDAADLRDMQPTPPAPDCWWWFVNYPRAKRARRMSTLWFALALVPALASIVLITLLAQRLAINGPDLLSGASVVAQVGLGLGSILAGRELMNDLIKRGANVTWHGQITFALATLFLIVVVIFYFLAPPAAATVYNVFGQQAIKDGNAAEAELYLESAARLDPDPHAAALLEVGCLYQTLGAPDRAEQVFERVLEADSRLLLARYYLAELYSDAGENAKSLQLLEDGLNLLEVGRSSLALGDPGFLPTLDRTAEMDDVEYLLRLARGRAYIESGAPEQAKSNLRTAEALYNSIEVRVLENGQAAAPDAAGRFELACGPNDPLGPYILTTQMDLHYQLARTYDALCDDQATISAALEEWRIVRNGHATDSRQEAWRDEAALYLSSGETCVTGYQPPRTTFAPSAPAGP